MKYRVSIFLLVILTAFTTLDIAPNPISANGIYTNAETKVRMQSEKVVIELFKEYSIIECTFNMVNHGKETSLEVGFPVMDFHHWSFGGYKLNDKSNFIIKVDNIKLSENDIKVPREMDSIYNAFMQSLRPQKEYQQKIDSIYQVNKVRERKDGALVYPKEADYDKIQNSIDSIHKAYRIDEIGLSGELITKFEKMTASGKYPWYVWNVTFEEKESRTIKVKYKLPSGLAYKNKFRYLKYILHTGAGWHQDIGNAEIIIHLNDINLKDIEDISPSSYIIDKKNKAIRWNFENLEPTEKDDIYLQYIIPKEKRKHNRLMKHLSADRQALPLIYKLFVAN